MRSSFSLPLILLGCALACGGSKVAPAPSITRFTASPSSLDVGATASLSAVFANGKGQVDPGALAVASGQTVVVSPVATTTYTLSVTGADGSLATSQATVAVNPGLLVTIQGLPAGVSAAVAVDGPGGYHQVLQGTQALRSLAAGSYAVTAVAVNDGTAQRWPIQAAQTATVTTTGAQVSVTYPAPTLSVPLPGDVSLDLVLVPSGSFMMGPVVPDQTQDWISADFQPANAQPRHTVTFRKAFYVTKFPVTIRQWKAVLGWTTPDMRAVDPDTPVWDQIWMEWHDVFLPALNKVVPGRTFRMTSEAEWEYAARAGSTTKYWWGDSFSDVDTYAWRYQTTIALGAKYPMKVGQKKPNTWGIHDLVNVPQFVEDDGHLDYTGAPTDGSAWIDNPKVVQSFWRVARGDWYSDLGPGDTFTYRYDSGSRLLGYDPSVGAGCRLVVSLSE